MAGLRDRGNLVTNDDIALMRRVVSRDPAALGEMFDRYHRLVFFIVNRIVADEPLAEELTSAVFLELWERPAAYCDGAFVTRLAQLSRRHALPGGSECANER
jgi:RNA polymerase sigma-70 factor (ECF subfamily)